MSYCERSDRDDAIRRSRQKPRNLIWNSVPVTYCKSATHSGISTLKEDEIKITKYLRTTLNIVSNKKLWSKSLKNRKVLCRLQLYINQICRIFCTPWVSNVVNSRLIFCRYGTRRLASANSGRVSIHVDPVKIFFKSSLIMQNLVALFDLVCAHEGGPKIVGDIWGPHSLIWDVTDP